MNFIAKPVIVLDATIKLSKKRVSISAGCGH